MIRNSKLPQFEKDYIISWDVSDKDHPCIAVAVLQRSEDGRSLETEVLGNTFEKTGVISLRQLLEQHSALKRAEAESLKNAEKLRKTFGKKEEGEL